MTPLGPHDAEVPEAAGFRTGQRVRLTLLWDARYEAAGVSREHRAECRAGGTILRLVVPVRHPGLWVSIETLLDSGTIAYFTEGSVEAA